MKTFENLISK